MSFHMYKSIYPCIKIKSHRHFKISRHYLSGLERWSDVCFFLVTLWRQPLCEQKPINDSGQDSYYEWYHPRTHRTATKQHPTFSHIEVENRKAYN